MISTLKFGNPNPTLSLSSLHVSTLMRGWLSSHKNSYFFLFIILIYCSGIPFISASNKSFEITTVNRYNGKRTYIVSNNHHILNVNGPYIAYKQTYSDRILNVYHVYLLLSYTILRDKNSSDIYMCMVLFKSIWGTAIILRCLSLNSNTFRFLIR